MAKGRECERCGNVMVKEDCGWVCYHCGFTAC